MQRIIPAITIVFLLLISPLKAQLPEWVEKNFDAYVEKSLERWHLPGLAVAVVKDGKVVMEKGFGVREFGKNKKVDEHSLFQIASNTKAFTGTAMAMLAEEEKCDLNDPVKKWIPNFEWNDPWVTDHATLTDILCHRMGIKTFEGDFTFVDTDLTQEEILAKLPNLETEYGFRTKWGYFNVGFMLAGMAMEKITGMTYPELIRKKILEPLEMDRTLMLEDEMAKAKNVALPHNYHDGKIESIEPMEFDQLAPAGSIVSSVHDMSHWLIANLSEGKYNGKEVIPADALAAARQPYMYKGPAFTPGRKTHQRMYGLGWEISDYEGREVIAHTGGLDGYVSSVTLVPEEGLGIVVLTNSSENLAFISLKLVLLDAFLGLDHLDYDKAYGDWQSTNTKVEEAKVAALRDTVAMKMKAPIEMSAFAGTYKNELYGTMDIHWDKGRLVMTLEHHPELSAELEFLADSRMLMTFSKFSYGTHAVPFKIKGNKVIGIQVKVNDFIEEDPYWFSKVE